MISSACLMVMRITTQVLFLHHIIYGVLHQTLTFSIQGWGLHQNKNRGFFNTALAMVILCLSPP
jgi:hypothetical protein